MQLSQKWVDKLVKLSESGMGYQIVDVRLKDGTVVSNVLVFNCEKVQDPASFSEQDIADIVLSKKSPQSSELRKTSLFSSILVGAAYSACSRIAYARPAPSEIYTKRLLRSKYNTVVTTQNPSRFYLQ